MISDADGLSTLGQKVSVWRIEAEDIVVQEHFPQLLLGALGRQWLLTKLND